MQATVFMADKPRRRITHLQQTFNSHSSNTCSFVYNGQKYHGEGKPLTGISRILNSQSYVWTIYTETGARLFTFAIYDEHTPIPKRKLSKWMREFV